MCDVLRHVHAPHPRLQSRSDNKVIAEVSNAGTINLSDGLEVVGAPYELESDLKFLKCFSTNI